MPGRSNGDRIIDVKKAEPVHRVYSTPSTSNLFFDEICVSKRLLFRVELSSWIQEKGTRTDYGCQEVR